MAGHSKWANIQYRKGRQDKQRGRIFTKLIREITVAARQGGGGDPNFNPRLRLAVDRAFAANMPKDNVERAIKKATGGLEGVTYEEIRYEGYGPAGVAIMVDCMTDNRTRTVGEVRHAFTKCGGNLGSDGSVAYLFTKAGVISFESAEDAEKILETAIDAGADDVITDEGFVEVVTTPEAFEAVRKALETAGLKPQHSAVTMRAATSVNIEGEAAQQCIKLLEMLEDLDDVQNVHSNVEFPESVTAGT